MTIKPYAAYKHSSVRWIGQIPANWSVSPLKRNTYIKGRVGWKGLTSDEFEIESDAYLVTGTDFRGRYIDWASCYQVSRSRYDDDPFIQLRDGDLLITKDGTIGKTSLVARLDKPACLNSGIFLVRPTADYLSEFLYWVLNSTVFQHFVELTSSGSTIQHLYQNVFENFAFGFPNIAQQRQIADYLDAQTAKIDALIGKQERLIETLAERRRAVTSHAVTKGLDPNAPMKDSGVGWVGRVPAHWAVGALKRYGRLSTGSTPSTDNPENFHASEGRPWIRPQDIDPSVRGTQASLFLSALGEGSAATIAPGSVLVVSTAWSISKIGYTTVECATNQQITAIQEPPCGEYLYLLLTAARDEILASMVINRLPIIGNARLGSIPLPIPPLEEQRAIVHEVDALTSRIDALSAKAREMIDVLKERRQALISAAVTGKIDVRGLA